MDRKKWVGKERVEHGWERVGWQRERVELRWEDWAGKGESRTWMGNSGLYSKERVGIGLERVGFKGDSRA
jgi:hypothetical protein